MLLMLYKLKLFASYLLLSDNFNYEKVTYFSLFIR